MACGEFPGVGRCLPALPPRFRERLPAACVQGPLCPSQTPVAGPGLQRNRALCWGMLPPTPPPSPQEQLSPEEFFMKSLYLRHSYGTVQYENWKDLEAVCQHPRGKRVTFTTGSPGVTRSWASPGGVTRKRGVEKQNVL